MNIRTTVLKNLAAIVAEFSPLPFPDEVPDDMRLDEFWLDSLAFANLLAGIETDLGCPPLVMIDEVSFPRTIGELVGAYEQNMLAAV
jgi:acyl carrier protein